MYTVHWTLTEYRKLFVSLQGFLTGKREVKPARACHVQLHSPSKDLDVGRSTLNGLSANLYPHSSHHHCVVIVHYFHRESSRLLTRTSTIHIN